MIILGIDPGSTRAGYGLIDFNRKSQKFLAGGIVGVRSLDKHERLVELRDSFIPLIKQYKPDIAGIERLYFVKNVKTGLEVAQSRGVLILCLQEKHVPIKEFTPSEVKRGVCGYGNADKKAVTEMVKKILRIKDLQQPDDTYDALAIALVAGYSLGSRTIK